MEFAVVGGDVRFAYLTRMLRTCGREAFAIDGVSCDIPNVPRAEKSLLPTAKNVVMNWPGDAEALAMLSPGTRAYFCGPGYPEEIPDGVEAVNLWKDERLVLENAWLTAEGAISAAMAAGAASLRDSPCLVIGWGRIGRALTEMLIGLNAPVTVASHSEKGLKGAIARGAESVPLEKIAGALHGKKIVFSTPPVPVLGERELRQADSDAMIIDLASAPHGVDLDAAKKLGLRAWREPKLPGRYCPFSAARALMKAILRAEGDYEK